MAVPAATEVRAVLEGYGVISTVLTDTWIDDCIAREIVPIVESITGLKFDGEQTITEYYSGNGTTVLMLNRKPVNSLVSITYVTSVVQSNLIDAVELIGSEGIIKARTSYSEAVYSTIFKKGSKNIKVTYTYGENDYPDDVKRAIENFAAARALNTIGTRTGGGSVSVQSHGRNYGKAGKYTDIRQELVHMARFLLRNYITGVVGS